MQEAFQKLKVPEEVCGSCGAKAMFYCPFCCQELRGIASETCRCDVSTRVCFESSS